MKKVFYGTLFLALVGIGVVGCKKTDLSKNEENVSTSILTAKANGRVYFDNGDPNGVEGIDYGCSGSGGGCLPEVTVKPSIVNPVKNVYYSAGNNSLVSTIFTNNKIDFFEIFGEQNVNDVISGVATVTVRGNISSIENTYFSFVKGGTIQSTVPVKI